MADELDFDAVEKLLVEEEGKHFSSTSAVDDLSSSSSLPRRTGSHEEGEEGRGRREEGYRGRSGSSHYYKEREISRSVERRGERGGGGGGGVGGGGGDGVRQLRSGRRRSRSRSPSIDRNSRRGGRDRERDREGRRRSVSRDNYGEREREREREREKEREARLAKEDDRRRKEEDERRRREIDEARRDDMTVLILNLGLKADERDIYEFFSEHAGKVRDIQCIRDQRSGRSKGVAYVEFYTQESVIKGLALSGQMLKGQPIQVQASQAEKNRAAKAAKIQQAEVAEGPMRLYVGGLIETLGNITENELKDLFSAFGEVTSVEIHKDPYTGRSKGYAFIQFRRATEAKEAMIAMNGFEIAGRSIKVGFATDGKTGVPMVMGGIVAGTIPGSAGPVTILSQPVMAAQLNAQQLVEQQLAAQQQQQLLIQQQLIDAQDNERLDDDGGGMLSGAGSKLALMQKLQRDNPAVSGSNSTSSSSAGTSSSVAAGGGLAYNNNRVGMVPLSAAAMNNITTNIILHNMFSAAEVDLLEDPEFFGDILEDVKEECSKFGTITAAWINRTVVDGKVWIKFAGVDQAMRAAQALNGRLFGGKPIAVEFVTDSIFQMSCR